MIEAIKDHITCSICSEIMNSIIKQCNSGHNMCIRCADAGNSCPICVIVTPSRRNYSLENVIAALQEMDTVPVRPTTGNGTQPNYQNYIIISNNPSAPHFTLNNWNTLTIDDNTTNRFEVQVVPCNRADKVFWYKMKIDRDRQAIYWALQTMQAKSISGWFYYEMAVHHSSIGTMRFRKICENNNKRMDQLIVAGNCIIIPFASLLIRRGANNRINFKCKLYEINAGSNQRNTAQNLAETVPPPLQFNNEYQSGRSFRSPSFLRGRRSSWTDLGVRMEQTLSHIGAVVVDHQWMDVIEKLMANLVLRVTWQLDESLNIVPDPQVVAEDIATGSSEQATIPTYFDTIGNKLIIM